MLLLNMAYVNWSSLWKRNQSIFYNAMLFGRIFSRGVYVNRPIFYGKRLNVSSRLNSMKNNYNSDKHGDNIDILTPHIWPPYVFKFPISNLFIRYYVDIIERKFIRNSEYVLWVNNPFDIMNDISLCLSKKAKYVVYDMSDDYEAFDEINAPDIRKNIIKILNISDVFIGVNNVVTSKYCHKNKITFNNSTNYDNFNNPCLPKIILDPIIPKSGKNKYIGFIGGFIKGRIDEELMLKILNRYCHCQVIVVGYTNSEDMLKNFSIFKNFIYLESVRYDNLPVVIKSFDVAIVPHLDNNYTRGNDLLKVLDYMAVGVPIVATNSSSLTKYKDCLFISNNNDEFIDNIDIALNYDNYQRICCGKKYARDMSWDRTVPELMNRIFNNNEKQSLDLY